MTARTALSIVLVLAVLVIGAGAAIHALADPERVRARAETELSGLAGRPVQLAGSIDIRLLPAPRAVIGAPRLLVEDRTEILRADRIDLALDPLGLIGQRSPIAGITLVRPVLAGPIVLGAGTPPAIRHVTVLDGTATVQIAPATPPLRLRDLSLDMATAGNGEMRLRLDAEQAIESTTRPLAVDATTRPSDSRGGFNLDLQVTDGTGDGANRLAWQGVVGGGADPHLLGRLQASAGGRLPDWLGLPQLAVPTPWQLDAQVNRGPARLELTDLAIRLAGGLAEGTMSLARAGGDGQVRLGLQGMALDALVPAIEGTLAAGAVPGRIACQLAGRDLTLHGLPVPRLDLSGTLAADGARIDQAQLALGTGGTLRLDEVSYAPDGRLAGRFDADLPDARPVLEALVTLPAGLAPDRPRSLIAQGALTAGPGALGIDGLDLRLDQSRFAGSLRRTGDRLALSGTVDRLELGDWLAGGLDAETLGRRLGEVPDGSYDLTIDRLGLGRVQLDAVHVEAMHQGDRLVISEARAGSTDSVAATLAGTIAPDGNDLILDLDVTRPARLATLLGLESPWIGRLGRITGQATLRGPADRVELDADLASGERRLGLSGVLGRHAETTATRLHATADVPDLAGLARELGALPADPALLGGPAQLQLDIGRSADSRWIVLGRLASRPVSADAKLDLRLGGDTPRVGGQLELAALPPGAASELYDLLTGPLALIPGSPLRWPGRWPADRLWWGWLYALDLDIALHRKDTAGSPDLGRIGLQGGRLDLTGLDVPLPTGGRLTGGAFVDGTGEIPSVGLDLALDDVALARATALVGIGRSPLAELDATLQLAGTGFTVADIVGDLRGRIGIALGKGSIPPGPGIEAEPYRFERIVGALEVERGIASARAVPLSIELPDGARRTLEATLDLPVWFLDAQVADPAGTPEVHLLGPPGRVDVLPAVSPTVPASAPDAPADRTPLP